ncbi:MAG: hypothetical protein EBZ77_08815 [Chitinophagia bacterium]|nr:hypothetical protein [Chitinophagia bacterium]
MPLLLFILNIVSRLHVTETVVSVTFLVSLIAIVVIALVAWKKIAIKWMLWAFNGTDNVHELQQAAALANLTNSYVSLNDLSKQYPEAYSRILERLNSAPQFVDDPAIPEETAIYFRKIYQNGFFYFSFILLAAGVITVIGGNFSGFIFGFPMVMVIVKWYNTFSNEPQLILSQDGICYKGVLSTWQEISNEALTLVSARTPRYTLSYNAPGGKEEIIVNDLNINPQRLNHLLFVYRGRNMRK